MSYYYVYINPNTDNTVGAVIPEFDKAFPNVPINMRFSNEFLENCQVVSQEQLLSQNIQCGMIYQPETDTYALPPEPEVAPVESTPEETPVEAPTEAPTETLKEG